MKAPALATTALFAIVPLLAGCGAPAGPVTPPMEDGKYVIHMTAGSMFQPANAKVPVDATVVWVNDGGVHDVTDGDHEPPQWSSDDGGAGKMQPGARYERRFAQPGTYHYKCVIHASTGMVGTLTVG